MNRYFLQLSYVGTNYNGWQLQPNGVTIQEHVNKALCTVLKEKINVTGAGRTDTGVHAKYFIAHFDTQKEKLHEDQKIIYNLNSLLPEDIAIQKIYKVKNDNHARFDAISRTYEYVIITEKNPFKNDLSYHYHANFDLIKMNEACKILSYYTDFTSFSKLHTQVKTNLCKIFFAHWEKNENMLVFTIKANRFLRNMVRAITGTIIEIGMNKINLNDFRNIIEKKDRSFAGISVPAKGLFLTDIEYPYHLK